MGRLIMGSYRCWIFGISLFLLSVCCSAQTRLNPEHNHFLQLTGSVGYSSLLDHSAAMPTISGTEAALGIGWRMYHNHFLFSTGLEASYSFFKPSMSEVRLELNMLDTEAMPFIMIADATSGRDVCHSLDFNIPLMFGGEYNRFYFQLGPVFSVNLLGRASSSANLTTTGDYDRYLGIFENMPNHYLTTIPVSSGDCRLRFGADVKARIEIGCRLGALYTEKGMDVPTTTKRGYISLFVDYGLLNVHRGTALNSRISYTQAPNEELLFHLTPALLSREWRDIKLNRLTVGIKATFLLELPQRKDCVICRD